MTSSPPFSLPVLAPALTAARRAAALAALSLATHAPSAHATTICRWVDASGRTQFAEAAPDAYQKLATCTDSRQYELTPAQRRAAERRVAADKASRARQTTGATPGSPPSPRAASAPQAKRPAEIVTDATDCATWWRLYDESAECFGPYRTTRGATRAEAFERCTVIASPEPKCGPRSN